MFVVFKFVFVMGFLIFIVFVSLLYWLSLNLCFWENVFLIVRLLMVFVLKISMYCLIVLIICDIYLFECKWFKLSV